MNVRPTLKTLPRLAWLAAALCLGATLTWGTLALAAETRGTSLRGLLFDGFVFSPILSQARPYRIYLPPGYDASNGRYPTVYMLHGAGGSYTEWDDSFMPAWADSMISSGEIQPMIIVMPDGGERQYWANWPNGPQWSDYVSYDVVRYVDTNYRTLQDPASRAIGGLSMGGLGALHIAFHHPDLFGVVGAHSPSIRPDPDPAGPFVTGRDFDAHNPIWLVQNRWRPDLRLNLWLDVGADDGWKYNIDQFRRAMDGVGMPYTWRVFPGTHEDTYWTGHVPDYLRFYSQALRGPVAPPVSDLASWPGDPSRDGQEG